MQRVEADEVGAFGGGHPRESGEVGEVADAPVARRAELVELAPRGPRRGRAPASRAGGRRRPPARGARAHRRSGRRRGSPAAPPRCRPGRRRRRAARFSVVGRRAELAAVDRVVAALDRVARGEVVERAHPCSSSAKRTENGAERLASRCRGSPGRTRPGPARAVSVRLARSRQVRAVEPPVDGDEPVLRGDDAAGVAAGAAPAAARPRGAARRGARRRSRASPGLRRSRAGPVELRGLEGRRVVRVGDAGARRRRRSKAAKCRNSRRRPSRTASASSPSKSVKKAKGRVSPHSSPMKSSGHVRRQQQDRGQRPDASARGASVDQPLAEGAVADLVVVLQEVDEGEWAAGARSARRAVRRPAWRDGSPW